MQQFWIQMRPPPLPKSRQTPSVPRWVTAWSRAVPWSGLWWAAELPNSSSQCIIGLLYFCMDIVNSNFNAVTPQQLIEI